MVNEIEEKAIAYVIEREGKLGEHPKDVHKNRKIGYDIESENKCIEVKGRSKEKPRFVHFSEYNYKGMTKAEEDEKEYWLYIVFNIGSNNPEKYKCKKLTASDIEHVKIPVDNFIIKLSAKDY